MLVREIMNANTDGRVHERNIGADIDVLSLDRRAIKKKAVYDVIDGDVKVGEVSGYDLSYIAESCARLGSFDLFELSGDGLIVIDENRRVCYVNSAYAALVGSSVQDLICQDMEEIVPEALLVDVLESGEPMVLRNRLFATVARRIDMQMFPLIRDGKTFGAFCLLHDVTEISRINRELEQSSSLKADHDKSVPAKIVWRSEIYSNVIDKISTVAPTDASVMIRGESGVGKELVARLIHQNSSRSDMPFVAVNCAAIPETLIESELFGYEEGSFTGARTGGKPGKFELAHGGTLFLDEIGDMPYTMQAKVLRTLQEGEIERVGGSESIPVDVRIIAATNQPLEEMIAAHLFRRDLYFRLNVISLEIPPLRERRDDILPLCKYFLESYNEKYDKRVTLSTAAYAQLEGYDWPGNIRQLQNLMESVVIMADGEMVDRVQLPKSKGAQSPDQASQASGQDLQSSGAASQGEASRNNGADLYRLFRTEAAQRIARGETDFAGEVNEFERSLILQILKDCSGNRAEAIERLAISRRTFYRKLEGIDKRTI